MANYRKVYCTIQWSYHQCLILRTIKKNCVAAKKEEKRWAELKKKQYLRSDRSSPSLSLLSDKRSLQRSKFLFYKLKKKMDASAGNA